MYEYIYLPKIFIFLIYTPSDFCLFIIELFYLQTVGILREFSVTRKHHKIVPSGPLTVHHLASALNINNGTMLCLGQKLDDSFRPKHKHCNI